LSKLTYILYSTDHCSLCDKALDLLLSMPELAGAALSVVDVALDDELLGRFGERVPVLCVRGPGLDSELEWPFDAATLRSLVVQSE
tara:strand:+ start:253 stop:510 length:258 start_codon:yes stop_codon:yes gene_type:complete